MKGEQVLGGDSLPTLVSGQMVEQSSCRSRKGIVIRWDGQKHRGNEPELKTQTGKQGQVSEENRGSVAVK